MAYNGVTAKAREHGDIGVKTAAAACENIGESSSRRPYRRAAKAAT